MPVGHVGDTGTLEHSRGKVRRQHLLSEVSGKASSQTLDVCFMRSLTSVCSCDDKLIGFFHRKTELLGLLLLTMSWEW